MKRTVTIPTTFVCIALGVLIALAGSQGSQYYNGISLFALCASVSYLLHWIIFIPSYIYQTEHYFDLTGSISYLSAIALGFYLNPSVDTRDILIGALIVIWAVRLGSFLFLRVKQDGKDNRFTVMKTQFHWYIMTWTMGGLWVFLTMAAGLAAITSDVSIPLGLMAYIGLALWIFGISIEVIADRQKRNFKKQQNKEKEFITSGLWAWSRHPNYFGEITLWTGITVMSLPSFTGMNYLAIFSPVFTYLLLNHISGVRILEARGMEKWGHLDEYNLYKKDTPKLFPRFFTKKES